MSQVVDAVNLLAASPWFGHATNFSSLLGGVTTNSSGHIVAARAARAVWSIAVPDSAALVTSQGSAVELEPGDRVSLAWERKLVQELLLLDGGNGEILPSVVSTHYYRHSRLETERKNQPKKNPQI